ncbi:MAG: hypothetical protein PHQ60_14345 [Sideroxydans sp.]|nr:hypothetical protein [Sideroxydans sp.]
MKRAIQSRLVFWAGLAFVVATLSGCANFQKQALDKSMAQKIDKVAIVDAREPVKYVTMNFGHPGMMFGAIGGAIAGADMEAKGTQFTNALRSKGFAIAQHLTDKTAENLLKRGYKVEHVPDTRVEKEGKLVLDYKEVKTDADVVMNITPTMVGYVSTRGVNSYIPTVGIVVEMVSKNSSEVIYREHFMYGWEPSAGQWIHVPAETGYSYSSFQDLMDKSANAADGLTSGAELVSARIAQDFQKN